jgi:flagellar L-ring protein FlgH
MSIRRFLIILAIFLLLPFTIKLRGEDFGQSQSLFTDVKARKVGDILTVLIFEQSRGTSQAETKTDKSTSFSTNGGPGVGSLNFVPLFGAKGDNKNTFNGKGENQRSGTLRAKMSVTVLELRPNDDLVVEGSRTVQVSDEKETLHLTGVVRQKDITPDNTIDSYLIADAQIHYTGKGNLNSARRPGFFTRLINWIF